MDKKSVGIIDGDFYIKNENKEFILQDKNTYLPAILSTIDNILSQNIPLTSISTIILNALKIIFNVNSIFKPPHHTSIIPHQDELYIYLVNYVKNNKDYRFKLEKSQRYNKELAEGYKMYKKKNEIFEYYKRENSIRYDNIDRCRGFRFYKW